MKEDVFGTEALAVREDSQRLNAFIKNNSKFIKQCAYKSVHKYVSDSDDEYAVALSAFHEAVRSFDETKGAFSTFAQIVIKRRLLDHMEKEYRHKAEISVEPYMMEGELNEDENNPIAFELKERTATLSAEKSTSVSADVTIRDEIEALSQALEPYGFGFSDLVECSPTAQKTKTACAIAIKTLIGSDELMSSFRKTRTLPMKDLSSMANISRKILDRHRRYIIAAVEIISGDYPLLSEYMKFVKEV
ncbi:RNA polymerase subunit sigma [Butyrivibrio sp. DSM 10294]|uniref:sigma factor n=1 Tax=Butyrivibrio sp. DSM 10294 TaxID=2972457 RepID=UPI00234F1373|nr:sigma factor [Butyrivibrio sp. DSM 10294]MDC7294864.1 RNA polymerase subunit sigma [Butyrivibrio sp. DSM 10294]